MQDYGRSGLHSQPYDNRIYTRKYEVEIGEASRPDIGMHQIIPNQEYTQRPSFTQGRSVQKNWPDHRYVNMSENFGKLAGGASGSIAASGFVSTFKPSR